MLCCERRIGELSGDVCSWQWSEGRRERGLLSSPMRQAANTSSVRQRFYLLGFQSCWSNQQLWKPGLGTFYFRVTAGQISDFRKTRRFIPPEWQQWLPVTRPQQQISGVIRKMYHNQHCSGLLQFPRNALDPASLTVWRLILFPIN